MDAVVPLAILRRTAERARASSIPFAALVSARGHADLGRRSLLASELEFEWSAPFSPMSPQHTVATLRRQAQSAFARGAQGVLVLLTHESAACFDRIEVFPDWLQLPRLQMWSSKTVMRSAGTDASGRWGEAMAPVRLEPLEISSTLRSWHADAVSQIHSAIVTGRLYQLCLTFPVRFAPPADPGALFAALISRQPVDHAAWVSLSDFELISASPERFLSVRGKEVVLQPMKGTRRLGGSEDEIARVIRGLSESIKDRAENVMITDLARNDLGRVCVPGSVRVDALFGIERYASVAQMTSTVRGDLCPGLDVWDALAAAFPPGSMTGAPKIEACRMIRELEQGPRGLYGGVLGWVEPNGDAEFSVVIRSLQSRGGEARWDIGGGIVHDSEPAAEWDEAWAKFEAVRPFTSPKMM